MAALFVHCLYSSCVPDIHGISHSCAFSSQLREHLRRDARSKTKKRHGDADEITVECICGSAWRVSMGARVVNMRLYYAERR